MARCLLVICKRCSWKAALGRRRGQVFQTPGGKHTEGVVGLGEHTDSATSDGLLLVLGSA